MVYCLEENNFFLIEMNPSIYKFHFVFTYIIDPQSHSVECLNCCKYAMKRIEIHINYSSKLLII